LAGLRVPGARLNRAVNDAPGEGNPRMSSSESPGIRRRPRIVAVAGARPNFMKIAPLLHEIRRRGTIDVFLVHTGQHYDAAMSDGFFQDLGIPAPDANLGVGSGSHAVQTAEVMTGIEAILLEQRPDAVLVVGDVNSTLAATIVAVKLGIRVAHVEAGLRSFDRGMPEEINRLLTDAVSHWLFVSEPSGERNLLREGTDPARIHFAGNVMIDTLLAQLDRAKTLDTVQRLGLTPRGYAVLTLHRPSNVDDPARLSELFDVLEEIQQRIPVVFPVHPRTADAIQSRLGGRTLKLRTSPPLGYLEFLRLMADARLVLTDSGGIQEETTVLGVPCLTLRVNTERPVTVEQGTNRIVGNDPHAIRAEVAKVLDGESREGRIPDRWDGHAAKRIVDVLERDLGEIR
jgi:UDP-N-acetylglucosamine 2-epimerase (non-hydrolysing)